MIQAIKDAPPHQSKAAAKTKATSPKDSFDLAAQQSPAPAGSKGWLASLFMKVVPRYPGDANPALAKHSEIGMPNFPVSILHDANEYNWASFFCPYCNATSFIQCGGGHFACDGTVEIRRGRRFRQCFCGNAGFIEGTIKTIEATQGTLNVEAVALKLSSKKSAAAIKKEQDPSPLPHLTDNDKKLLP